MLHTFSNCLLSIRVRALIFRRVRWSITNWSFYLYLPISLQAFCGCREVWLALWLGSPVAVKTILARLQDKEKLVDRFIEEIIMMR